jgi:hypothetical protein
MLGEDVCAAIRAPTTVNPAMRFAFLKRGCAAFEELTELLARARVEQVAVDDFDAPTLSVGLPDLESFIDGPLPPLHVFDPERFAVNDLVFVSE